MTECHCEERSDAAIFTSVRNVMGIASSLALLAMTVFAVILPARAQDRVLNIYNWTDYIDPAALKRFQTETGITVHYDVFDSLETLEAKMLAGHSGYDVVVPSNEPTLSRLIKVGALAPIDRSRVPNWKNLDPVLMHQVESSDPGNRYGAIYLWGTTGIGMIADRVKQLAPDAAMDSWDLLFKPENAGRIAPCGITMMDSAIDVIPGVLKYLGKSPDSTDPADLAAVSALPARPASRSTIPAMWFRRMRVRLRRNAASQCAMSRRRRARNSASTCWRFRPTPSTRTRRWRSSTSCCSLT